MKHCDHKAPPYRRDLSSNVVLFTCSDCGREEIVHTHTSDGGQLFTTTYPMEFKASISENLHRPDRPDHPGGTHYSRLAVQPFDLIRSMESSGNAFVDYARGCVIKYATRKKGDLTKMAEDLRKAEHYCKAAAEALEKV